MKNQKYAKIYFNKGGGTSGVVPKLSIPKSWIDDLKLTKENNVVLLTFKNKKIIIEKGEKFMTTNIKIN